MVKMAVTAVLEGGKEKLTQVVKTDIDESINKYEDFRIYIIKLAGLEWYSEQTDGRRATTIKLFTPNNINECMMLNNFSCTLWFKGVTNFSVDTYLVHQYRINFANVSDFNSLVIRL